MSPFMYQFIFLLSQGVFDHQTLISQYVLAIAVILIMETLT